MKSEGEIFRMFEFQEKERIFPKRMFEFQRKKEFPPKFLTKLARFWLKSDIFIKEMIGDHFMITHDHDRQIQKNVSHIYFMMVI